jgi:transcriptional regulator with XRE-family HTH domain
MANTNKIPTQEVFARRLRDCRKRAGLSQMRLGVLAGIDERSASPRINQYERGKHFPDVGTITRLALALEVPPAYFFAEDEHLAAWILFWHDLADTEKQEWLARTGAQLNLQPQSHD